MKRFFRWALILIVLLLTAGAVSGLFIRSRLLRKPAWYTRMTLDADTQRLVANNADQKLLSAFNKAHQAQIDEVAAHHSHSSDDQVVEPSAPITLELTEDEINAFLAKWQGTLGWSKTVGKYLQEPMIVLQDGEIILAATVNSKDWNSVMSLHFEPKLQNGKLDMRAASVMAGMLPVPKSYFSTYVEKLTATMEKKLPAMRHDAEIGPRGWANAAAVDAAMSELLIHIVKDELSEPVLFVPEAHEGHDTRSLPVQITGINIANKTLSLTVVPMNANQREEFLKHLRGNEATETALVK